MSDYTNDLLRNLTKAVSFHYKTDTTCPNITISKLPYGYYCSIVRYVKRGAVQKKEVVCHAKGVTMGTALDILTNSFLKLTQVTVNPIQELQSFLNKSSYGN